MDALAWAKRLHDDPPKRPGEALALTLSALVTFCDQATPIAPKNVTPAAFFALRDDPEFDDLASEVLSIVSSYYAEEAASEATELPELARSSSTPRVVEVIGAAFEHASVATGVDGAGGLIEEVVNDMLKYWNIYQKGVGAVDALGKLLGGPMAYVLTAVCGVGLVIEMGNAYTENQANPAAAPRAWTKKQSVRHMLVGLVWFAGHEWTRVGLAFDTPSEPSTRWTPYRKDREVYWNKNATTRLLRPDFGDFKQVVEFYHANTTLDQRNAYNKTGTSNYIMLKDWYNRNGHTPENLLKYPLTKARRGLQNAAAERYKPYASRIDSILNLTSAVGVLVDTELEPDAMERETDRLSEFLDVVIEDHRNGNSRYSFYNNADTFFFFSFVFAQGGVVYRANKQRGDLYPRLRRLYDLLDDPRYRPYFPNAGPGFPNSQDDISDAARIILAFAQRNVYDDMDEYDLENNMRELLDIRKAADRHNGQGNNPMRGELNGPQTVRVTSIRNDAWQARDNWDQNNPTDMINASCADGSSSVVDALFAKVGL